MVVKETFNYGAKRKAREELKDFISQHYPNSRQTIKVLTLLGHEEHGLKEIWDGLNIPRQNITVVERDSEVYNLLMKKKLDVNLIKGDVNKYLANTDQNFDIINLDYHGYFNLSKIKALQHIAYNKILNGRGILATWYSGRREDETMQRIFEGQACQGVKDVIEQVEQNPQILGNRCKSDLEDRLLARLESIKEDGGRSDSISEIIYGVFFSGKLNFEQHPLISALKLRDEYVNFVKKSQPFGAKNKEFLKILTERRKPEGHEKVAYEAFLRARTAVSKSEQISREDEEILIQEFHKTSGLGKVDEVVKKIVLNKFYDEKNKFGEDFLNAICKVLKYQKINNYLPEDVKRFTYHSNKGTPMFVDFNLFVQKDPTKVVEWESKQGRFRVKKKKMSSKLINKIKDFHELSSKVHFTNYKEREAIELEYRFLDKEEIYSLLKEGKTDAEILDIDPSLANSLRAYKAHITMDEKGIQKGRRKKEVLPLTKEQIFERFDKGATVKDICNQNPNLNYYKVKAYKAVHTMKINGIKMGRPRKAGNLEITVSDEVPEAPEIEIQEQKILSEAEAVDLLKSGCSTKEIAEAYPGAFTAHQLGALQYWHVKGGKGHRKKIA